MKTYDFAHWGACLLFAFAVASPVLAAQTTVRSGDDAVVIDGDQVRIRADGKAVDVDNAWRRGGADVSVADVDRSVVELGGVVGEDVIQLNLAGDVLFEFDSASLSDEARQKLAQAASVIRARAGGEVHVIGHTDAKGSADYNRRLSRERATTVIRWLNSNEGIPARILVGSGAGAAHPVAHNTLPDGRDDPEGRARNRRVEIQIARSAGVKLGPGLVRVEGGKVSVGDVVVEGDTVSVGDVRVDSSTVTVGGVKVDTGGVDISGLVGAQGASPTPAKPAAAGGNCERMCAATAGSHPLATIGCVEGELEEQGYKFDTGACDQLEEAMFTGVGNANGKLCQQCRSEQGFSDAHCGVVLRSCF